MSLSTAIKFLLFVAAGTSAKPSDVSVKALL